MPQSTLLRDDGSVVAVDRTEATAGPIDHGKRALLDAIEKHGMTMETTDHWSETDAPTFLVIGTLDDRPVGRLLSEADASPEDTFYRWCETDGGTALVVGGTDDRGLMYALLELAERIEVDGPGVLDAVEDAAESPDNEVRGIDRLLVNPDEDRWFYDDEFWNYYFDRLARCRYNRFTLVMGYDTAFMSPPYPFLVDVPGYPEASVTDDDVPDRETHRKQLREIGRQCERHGLEFVVGIWQQRPRSINPDLATTEQGVLIEGVPEDEESFTDYCASGLRELLVRIPEIDGVQLRINYESGVGDRSTAEVFWREIIDAVGAASNERTNDVTLDLRAKGLTDGLIQYALETGQDVEVPTKFWCEGTGLPYHNARMREKELEGLDDMNLRRRYSYADLLGEPRAYDVLYRLWVYGTNRILLWGDPDYARRFSHAAGFGDSVGYEITAPLSQKGGRYFLREAWPLHQDSELRHYEYEDERYWAWYRLFGRLGYSADTDSAVWEREFRDRFGDGAEPIMRGYRSASKILPLLTSTHLTRHSANLNWMEVDTGGPLFEGNATNDAFEDLTYGSVEPSDPELFYGIDEYVADAATDDVKNKYAPLQVARWLEAFESETRDAVNAADGHDCESREYRATRLDLLILADLAAYHAAKTRAAVTLERYRMAGNVDELRAAYDHATTALDHWTSVVDRAEGTYHDEFVFGRDQDTTGRNHWRDGVPEIEADIDELGALLENEGDGFGVERDDRYRTTPFATPSFTADVPDKWRANEDLPIAVRASELDGIDELYLQYRRADQTEGTFERTRMDATDTGYRGIVPAEYITLDHDLLIYFATVDDAGNGIVIPGLYHAEHAEPYYTIEITS